MADSNEVKVPERWQGLRNITLEHEMAQTSINIGPLTLRQLIDELATWKQRAEKAALQKLEIRDKLHALEMKSWPNLSNGRLSSEIGLRKK